MRINGGCNEEERRSWRGRTTAVTRKNDGRCATKKGAHRTSGMLLFLLYFRKYALSYLLHRVSIIFHRLHPVLAHSAKETLQRVVHFLFHNRKNLDLVVLLSYIYLWLPQRKHTSFYLFASGRGCLKHHITPNVLIGLADILKNLLKHLHFVILLINCYPLFVHRWRCKCRAFMEESKGWRGEKYVL